MVVAAKSELRRAQTEHQAGIAQQQEAADEKAAHTLMHLKRQEQTLRGLSFTLLPKVSNSVKREGKVVKSHAI